MSISRSRALLLTYSMMIPCVIYSQSFSGSTCAIVHRNNLGIFVGADSKVTNTGNLPEARPECKIHTKDGVIFFGSGSVRGSPIYDGYIIATSVISRGLSLATIISAFVDSIRKLAAPLGAARMANPERFDSCFQEFHLFDFTFIKHEQDSILFALCEFKYAASLTSDLMISRRISLGADIPKPTMLYGERDAIRQAMREAKTNTLAKARSASQVCSEIERLIELQFTQTPDHVGLPVQIIWMRSDGRISWLKNAPPCEPTINY